MLDRVAAAIRPLLPDVAIRGTSDLARSERKFSGNSLRCRREALLYHGTLLYDFPLDLVGTVLRTPPRMPDYREQRPHGAFVGNLPTTRVALEVGLQRSFAANETVDQEVLRRLEAVAESRSRRKIRRRRMDGPRAVNLPP
ncbi:MAG: hypothetical protein QM775_01965 [Pirellulales bacterium]